VVNALLPVFVSGISYNEKLEQNYPGQFRLRKMTVVEAWTASHILLAVLLFSTIFVTSKIGGIVIVGCLGISWALTLWAPFAIIGVEIASLRALRAEHDEDQYGNARDFDAGVILSLHNIAISAPQIFAALLCSFIFSVAHILGSSDGIGWTLRIGGFAALGAAWLSRRLSRDIRTRSLLNEP
jgi:solute carrier family 45 protein 1/2/4